MSRNCRVGLRRLRGLVDKGDQRGTQESRTGQGEGVGCLARWMRGWRVCLEHLTHHTILSDEGRSPEQATARLDHIISEIRKFHIGNMQSERPGDVVLLTHGKISRAFIKRWVGLSLSDPNEMLFEPGAIGALRSVQWCASCSSDADWRSYYHQDINRPAMVFGLSV